MSPLPTSASTNQQSEKRAPRSISRRRRLIFVTFTAFALLGFYSISAGSNVAPLSNLFASLWSGIKSLANCRNQMASSTDPAVASAEGWHSRLRGDVASTEFNPSKSDLLLTVLMSSQVEQPQGFTMALFKPGSVVDASGGIHTLSDEDFVAFESIIEAVKALPHTDGFRGQWRVAHPRTSFPIDRILITGDTERSVYGWSKDTTVLETATKGYANLPDELQRLVGWAREARTGYVKGSKDEMVIGKVLALMD